MICSRCAILSRLEGEASCYVVRSSGCLGPAALLCYSTRSTVYSAFSTTVALLTVTLLMLYCYATYSTVTLLLLLHCYSTVTQLTVHCTVILLLLYCSSAVTLLLPYCHPTVTLLLLYSHRRLGWSSWRRTRQSPKTRARKRTPEDPEWKNIDRYIVTTKATNVSYTARDQTTNKIRRKIRRKDERMKAERWRVLSAF